MLRCCPGLVASTVDSGLAGCACAGGWQARMTHGFGSHEAGLRSACPALLGCCLAAETCLAAPAPPGF
eukprot:1158968-Pelagomonas_calceolata.AAC.7